MDGALRSTNAQRTGSKHKYHGFSESADKPASFTKATSARAQPPTWKHPLYSHSRQQRVTQTFTYSDFEFGGTSFSAVAPAPLALC